MATVTLLSLKSTFFEFLGELYQGSVTAGSSLSVADSALAGYTSEVWPAKIVGQQIRITSGGSSGDLRMIGKFAALTGNMYPNRAFSSSGPTALDTYELWGATINGGTPLTTLFNTAMRDLRPITDTQITIVTSQRMYDVSTLVQSRRDIHGVYVRLLDAANVEPYRLRELAPGMEWWAYDRGGNSTESVTLELANSLTLNTATTQLWLRGETTFTALVDDTSTVDADFRDWLAWEAIMELTRRKEALGTYDKPRWSALKARAIEELQSHRARWLAGHEPVRIATWA